MNMKKTLGLPYCYIHCNGFNSPKGQASHCQTHVSLQPVGENSTNFEIALPFSFFTWGPGLFYLLQIIPFSISIILFSCLLSFLEFII